MAFIVRARFRRRHERPNRRAGAGRTPRRGFFMVEALLAAIVIGGPLVVMFGLLIQSSREANHLRRRALAEQMVLECSSTLLREDRAHLEDLIHGDLKAWCSARLRKLADALPERDRDTYLGQSQGLIDTLNVTLEHADGGPAGLYALKVSMRCDAGSPVEVIRLKAEDASPSGDGLSSEDGESDRGKRLAE